MHTKKNFRFPLFKKKTLKYNKWRNSSQRFNRRRNRNNFISNKHYMNKMCHICKTRKCRHICRKYNKSRHYRKRRYRGGMNTDAVIMPYDQATDTISDYVGSFGNTLLGYPSS